MKTSDVDIVIVPGLGGSGDEHWQTRWARKLPTARTVVQTDWERPNLAEWTARLVAAVDAATRPAVLVGHSLGVMTIAHAADRIAERVVGAFLVAAPSAKTIREIAEIDSDFAETRTTPLPFPSVLVASRDDPYCTFAESEALAKAWHATLVDAGASGHLNHESGHGPWPEGLMRFAGFLKTLS